MARSATDVMHDIIFAAVMDSVAALKDASKGVPNSLLRDINALHPNTAFDDLPKEVQAAIAANVRAAFNRLLKEGYSVAPAGAAPPRPAGGERRPPRNATGGRPAGKGPGGRPGGGPRKPAERPTGDKPRRPPRPR